MLLDLKPAVSSVVLLFISCLALTSLVMTSTPLFLAQAMTVFMDPKSTPTTDILTVNAPQIPPFQIGDEQDEGTDGGGSIGNFGKTV